MIALEVATYRVGPAMALSYGSAELGGALVQQAHGCQAVMAHLEIATALEVVGHMEPAATGGHCLAGHYTGQEMDVAPGTSLLEEDSADMGVARQEAAYPAKSGR